MDKGTHSCVCPDTVFGFVDFKFLVWYAEMRYRTLLSKEAIDMKAYQKNMSRDKSGKYEVISY